MNTFEDLQRLRGDRWRHCQLNNLKVPVFQTFILLKVVCHRIEKKDYCHLLVEKGRWIFAIPSPVYFFGPTFGFTPCKLRPGNSSGEGWHGAAFLFFWQRIWTFFLGPSNSVHDGVRRECWTYLWGQTLASQQPVSLCISKQVKPLFALTHRYTEFPNLVSPHPNLGEWTG